MELFFGAIFVIALFCLIALMPYFFIAMAVVWGLREVWNFFFPKHKFAKW
jgi:hypothetical protein